MVCLKVPILGTLLFIIYIGDVKRSSNSSFMNDLAHIFSKLYSILFADDTNRFVTRKKLQEMMRMFNIELEKLISWLAVNRPSLNIDNTNYMGFKG